MRQAHVSLYCEQGQLHRPMNEQERNAASSADSSVDSEESAGASGCQKYNTSTKKPTEPDHVCPFRLNIYMVSEDAPVDAGRWFVSHINVNKRTCAWHRGHIRLRPSELHNYLTNMSEEEKELAEQCAKLRFSTSSTAALLGSRSAGGLTYQANQISYLSRVVCDIGKHGQSTADRLVSTFSNRTDVCWLMVTLNPEEGLLLQATAKDRQKLLKLKRNDP